MAVIIGIAGGTGSGKTTLACALRKFIGENRSYIIPLDSYYKDRSPLELEMRESLNFDQPEAFDLDLVITQLKELKEGKTIELPIYDYTSHTRTKETLTIPSADFIILEGILLFSEERIRLLLDLKIFLEASPHLRFKRRLSRDIKERGRTEESVKKQYEKTVLPMHNKYIEPSRQFADLVVSGEGPIEESWEKIKEILKKYL